jgi:hypothetical protein
MDAKSFDLEERTSIVKIGHRYNPFIRLVLALLRQHLFLIVYASYFINGTYILAIVKVGAVAAEDAFP